MYSVDSATKWNGDSLRATDGNNPSEYKTPELLESETGVNSFQYNELVINSISPNAEHERMKPSYLIYIQKKSEYEYQNKIQAEQWEETVKAASEFNIPIVVLDAEQIMVEQRNNILKKLEYKTLPEDAILPSLRHFIERYGSESINNIVSEDLIEKAQYLSEDSPINIDINIEEGDSR